MFCHFSCIKVERNFNISQLIRVNRRRILVMQVALNYVIARRRLLLGVSLVLLLLLSARNITRVPRSRLRSCRRLSRNTGWCQKVWNTYSDARFKKTLRMSRETFCFILSLRDRLERETVTEEPISSGERLGICLYRLRISFFPKPTFYFWHHSFSSMTCHVNTDSFQPITNAVIFRNTLK